MFIANLKKRQILIFSYCLALALALLLAVGCAQEPEATTPPAEAADPVTVTEAGPPANTPEPEPEPESGPVQEDHTISQMTGAGYYSKSIFTQEEQDAINAMLDAIVPGERNDLEEAWTNQLFSVTRGDTAIIFWPNDRVTFNGEGYDCSGIDYDILIDVLSRPVLTMEINKSQEDIDAAMVAFQAFFADFEQQGCAIEKLWYEDFASAYYTLSFFGGAAPDEAETANVIALFLRYSAGSGADFFGAPQDDTLVIYLMRTDADSPWEFVNWFGGAITEE